MAREWAKPTIMISLFKFKGNPVLMVRDDLKLPIAIM